MERQKIQTIHKNMNFPSFFNKYFFAIILAAILDIIANLMLARSRGFKNIAYGVFSLICVGLAFSALAYATLGLDLAVAYAMWGGFGILGTSLGGWFLLGQKLKTSAWIGIIILISGIITLHIT